MRESKEKDGGPAFPVNDTTHPSGQVQYGQNGMSLRDWMAGMALTGMLSFPGRRIEAGCEVPISDMAYKYADAMLLARERKAE